MFNHGYFSSFMPDFFEALNMPKNEPLFSFFGFADATSAGADVVRAGADALASGTSRASGAGG